MVFRCNVGSCSSNFNTLNQLISHLKQHLKYETAAVVICPYPNCFNTYKIVSSFSSHLSRIHKSNLIYAKTLNKIGPSTYESNTSESVDIMPSPSNDYGMQEIIQTIF